MSFLGEGIFLVPFSFAGYIFGLVSGNEKVRLGFMRAIYNLAFTTFIVQSLKFFEGKDQLGQNTNILFLL
jgi:hypothetical protein